MSSKVLSKKDGWIGQITPSRPKVLNTIDDDLPGELANAVTQAHADPDVRLMILSGAERGGYRALRRPHLHGRYRKGRPHASPCVGLSDDHDVGLPAWCRESETHVVGRRHYYR